MLKKSTIVVFLALIFTSNSYATDPSGYYYPPKKLGKNNWRTISPNTLGWNNAALNDAIDYVEEQGSTAFIILYKGRKVKEKYWDGWDLHTKSAIHSAHKTIAGVMFGIAQEEGIVAQSDKVSDYISNWSNATSAQESLVSIEHLQLMTSGMSDVLGFFRREINYETVPDAEWRYNTVAYDLMRDIIGIQNPDGDYDQFIQSRLYDAIGMHDSEPHDGRFSKGSSNSARDLARFGLMMLGDGTWKGEDIIQDKQYLADMLTQSQPFNESYGILTWLNGDSYILPGSNIEVFEGPMIPTAPSDLFAALGSGDKKIYMVPSLDLVVVRHGPAALEGGGLGPSGFDSDLWEKLCLAIGCSSD